MGFLHCQSQLPVSPLHCLSLGAHCIVRMLHGTLCSLHPASCAHLNEFVLTAPLTESATTHAVPLQRVRRRYTSASCAWHASRGHSTCTRTKGGNAPTPRLCTGDTVSSGGESVTTINFCAEYCNECKLPGNFCDPVANPQNVPADGYCFPSITADPPGYRSVRGTTQLSPKAAPQVVATASLCPVVQNSAESQTAK